MPKDIANRTVPESVAEAMAGLSQEKRDLLELLLKQEKEERSGLSYAQKQMWFLNQMEPAGTAPPHVTFRCETERFVLMMYRRLTLEPLRTAGQLVVEGDHGLTTAFDQWLKAA